MKTLVIHTDGSCLGNPGRGGWAALLSYQEHTKELSGGFAHTTNNRMEHMAAIVALESVKEPCEEALYTDSQYVRNAVEKRWLAGWKKNGWRTASKSPVKNQDLWQRLDAQLARHKVAFFWVKGHAGHPENERCDILARSAAESRGLPPDPGMEG